MWHRFEVLWMLVASAHPIASTWCRDITSSISTPSASYIHVCLRYTISAVCCSCDVTFRQRYIGLRALSRPLPTTILRVIPESSDVSDCHAVEAIGDRPVYKICSSKGDDAALARVNSYVCTGIYSTAGGMKQSSKNIYSPNVGILSHNTVRPASNQNVVFQNKPAHGWSCSLFDFMLCVLQVVKISPTMSTKLLSWCVSRKDLTCNSQRVRHVTKCSPFSLHPLPFIFYTLWIFVK